MKRIALASLILALQLNVIAATDVPWMPESHQAPGPGDSKVYERMLKVLQDPEIILQKVKFRNGSDSINGFLARPRPNKTGRLPALVVVPGDPGLTAYTRVTAAQFAQAGFVALAVDIFSRAA
jgi:Dienelactone hydrolase family